MEMLGLGRNLLHKIAIQSKREESGTKNSRISVDYSLIEWKGGALKYTLKLFYSIRPRQTFALSTFVVHKNSCFELEKMLRINFYTKIKGFTHTNY